MPEHIRCRGWTSSRWRVGWWRRSRRGWHRPNSAPNHRNRTHRRPGNGTRQEGHRRQGQKTQIADLRIDAARGVYLRTERGRRGTRCPGRFGDSSLCLMGLCRASRLYTIGLAFMLTGILKDLFHAVTLSTKQWAKRRLTITDRPPTSAPKMFEEEAACRRTLELMPNFAEAHNRLGVVLKDSKRLAEAEAAFRRAINLQRDNVASHYNLGIVLAETNRPLEAEAAYRDALRLQPNFVEAHNNLGVVLLGAKGLTE